MFSALYDRPYGGGMEAQHRLQEHALRRAVHEAYQTGAGAGGAAALSDRGLMRSFSMGTGV